MGNEIDLHSAHWHGEPVIESGHHTDVIELLPGSMKTADMIADNPGTWMFHCHVEDHMEGGMMAVYTIYTAPTRSCPIEFDGGEFWKNSETFSLTVRNTGNKSISQLRLTSEMFLAPQDLRRPSGFEWSSKRAIAPGQRQVLGKRGTPP